MESEKNTILVDLTRVERNYVVGRWLDYTCFCHRSDVSDYYVDDCNLYFTKSKRYLFEVIQVDEVNKNIKVSYKTIHPMQIKKVQPLPTLSGFSNLREYLDKWVESENNYD